MSLGEFHSAVPSAAQVETTTAAPTQATPQLVRINWADEMEKLDDTNLAPPADFVFDRSKLPSAPKAVLAPEFDLESVPKKPPFTAHLSNVSFEADEAKIRGFFRDSKVLNVRLPLDERGRFKGHGFVDFEDRESLIAALQKNETSFFNRQIRVALESAQKKQYHQQNQQQTENKSDEADWRRQAPAQEEVQQTQPNRQFGGYHHSNEQRGNRYQQRRSGGQNQWQQVGGGHHRQHHQQDQQQQRRQYSGYQQRQQKEHGYSSGEHSADQLSSSATTTPTTSMTEVKERPKLNLAPRTIPVVDATSSSATEKSASIFGSAKPVNTAAREREIEEKIKKEREEAERIEKERKQKEEEEKEKAGEQVEAENTEEPKETMKRTHKTSYSSDHHKSQDNEFQVVGGSGKPRYNNKNDNNNNTIRNQNRLMQSGSFTSPPGSHHQRRDHPQQYHKKQEGQQHERYNKESAESSKPAENAWQSRNAATDLFNKERPTHSETGSNEINHRAGGNRQPHQNEERRSHPHPNRRPDHQNRPQSNRDNKDRRQFDRNKQMNKNPRGERPQTNDRPVRNPRQDTTGFGSAEQSNKNDLGFVNKFSNLAVDVEDADEIYDDNDEVEQEA